MTIQQQISTMLLTHVSCSHLHLHCLQILAEVSLAFTVLSCICCATPSCRRFQQNAFDCAVSADLCLNGLLSASNATPNGLAAAAAALFSPYSQMPCMQRLATPPPDSTLKQKAGP